MNEGAHTYTHRNWRGPFDKVVRKDFSERVK